MIQATLFIAGIFGCSALILDAIGAHALTKWLSSSPDQINSALQNWQSAVRYQLVHTLLLLVFGLLSLKQVQWNLVLGAFFAVLGSLLFCGGIYSKILTGNALFGRVTPFGGTCLMLAWLCLVVTAFRFKH